MRTTVIIGAALILLTLMYVLSYAPAYRQGLVQRDSRWQSFYSPVTRLIDDTPLREPLLMWAAAWGVRDRIEFDSELRTGQILFQPAFDN